MPILSIPGVLKPPAAGYTHSMTVGQSGVQYGYQVSLHGSISPTTIEGVTIDQCVGRTDNNNIRLRFSGSQIGSATDIEIEVEGYGTTTVFWNTAVTPDRYDTVDSGLASYLAAQNGNTLGLNFTDVTGGGSTPLGA